MIPIYVLFITLPITFVLGFIACSILSINKKDDDLE